MAFLLKLLGPAGIVGLSLSLALAALLGLQTHKTHVAQKATARAEQLFHSESLAHQATIRNYRAAALQAAQADAANVARVKAQQAVINERSLNEYQARLADARARADRLRSQLGQAGSHPGSSPAAGLPGPVVAPSSAHPATPQDGFSVTDRLIATEQAIQLDELIKWVKSNVTIDYSNRSPSSSNVSR